MSQAASINMWVWRVFRCSMCMWGHQTVVYESRKLRSSVFNI